MGRKAWKMSVYSIVSAAVVAGSPIMASAALTAGVSGVMTGEVSTGLVAGVSLTCSNYMLTSEASVKENGAPLVAEGTQDTQIAAEETNPYADIAIAQVDNYVNIRSEASEEGEILGKLYDNSAATVHGEENGWYQITSGTVTGYVKCEYVVVGDEELAKEVSRRVATVNTETLFVRKEPSTEAAKLGMVANQDDLTVVDESIEGWVKVTIEEGEGYVSSDYVTLSTEFVQAESKAEEEARLAREEAERKAAAAAAAAATAKKSSSSSSSSSAATTTYNPPTGGTGQDVANFACQFVGNPYVSGGSSLTNGADCSGFVMAVYAQFGVSLPHSSGAMRSCGYGVGLDQIQPGDIVCYSGHVGIYVGNNTIVHASTPSSGIKYTSPVDYKTVLAVRRIF
ncbi:MAG: SH3 domain-containing protein [Roseburia sp.]